MTKDEGISLLEAERIAREREPGDGSSQRTVVEQIETALEPARSITSASSHGIPKTYSARYATIPNRLSEII